jgi:RNA-binding protein
MGKLHQAKVHGQQIHLSALEDFDQGVAVRFKTRLALSGAYSSKYDDFERRVSAPGSQWPRLYNDAMDKQVTLSEKQTRYLRGLAHPLSPIIRLGKEGLTDAVVKETTRALHDHELIKVKALGGDRDARDAAFTVLAERTSSALVHRIGNVAVLYRPRKDLKRILIPD